MITIFKSGLTDKKITSMLRIKSAQEHQYNAQPASQRMFFGMKTDELDSPPQYLLVSAAFEQLPGFG